MTARASSSCSRGRRRAWTRSGSSRTPATGTVHADLQPRRAAAGGDRRGGVPHRDALRRGGAGRSRRSGTRRSSRYFTDAASIAERVASARALDSIAGLLPEATADDVHAFIYYNARGQKIGQVDAEGYLTEVIYDVNGNVTRTIRYAQPGEGGGDGHREAARAAPRGQHGGPGRRQHVGRPEAALHADERGRDRHPVHLRRRRADHAHRARAEHGGAADADHAVRRAGARHG